MPRRSAIELLPESIREELDRRLISTGFSGYVALSEWLKQQGFEIGKTAVNDYGQSFEERCKALKLVTQQARAIVAEAPDDDNAVNEALIRLSQEKAFQALMEMQLDPESVDLPKLMRAIAEMARASVQQKKYMAQVQEKARQAADEVAAAVKKGGLSDDTAEEIRKRILGIGA